MTTLKPLNQNDVAYTRTLLHEAIPLTGTIISGTYGTLVNGTNIKNYSHGMFQSVYDYPYLSSSANHIFDVTIGLTTDSNLYSKITTAEGQQSKKKNIYNQMAQVLAGYDVTGSILQFDEDGDIVGGGAKMQSSFIVPFSRLLVKDEIKKESFSMTLGVSGSYATPMGSRITISDVSASTEYRVNSPVGEYGILYATSSVQSGPISLLDLTSSHRTSINGVTYWYAGLLYYQAGIMVLTSSIFGSLLNTGKFGVNWVTSPSNQNGPSGSIMFSPQGTAGEANMGTIESALTGTQISASADWFRRRIYNLQFNNTTELNSTVYFCRANHNEFNYSSNPTYLDKSKIRVKNQASDDPLSFITTIGLYNDNNELLATAKLSEPLKKTPSTELTLRVRLDY